jgi:hypothetical protein
MPKAQVKKSTEVKEELPKAGNVKSITPTKKTVFTETNRIVNQETGEVVQTVTNSIARASQEPKFIKVYLEDINRIYSLPRGCSPALYEILKEMNWKGIISLTKYTKDQCAAAAGLTPASFNNCISDLIKKDILKRLGQSVYMANPHLFGQGNWIEVMEKREAYLQISYKNGKREVTSSFDPANPENQHDNGQKDDDEQQSA